MGPDVGKWVIVVNYCFFFFFLNILKDFLGDSSEHVGLKSLAYS